MISSTNNGGFAQQLEAIRQRLAAIRDRIQSNLSPTIQIEIDTELQSAIEVLQTAQVVIQQAEEDPEIERLRTSVQEKEMLLREIHHRIKNNLQIVTSLLDLQAIRTQDATVQALLLSNQTRIRSIALVHERLSQSSNAATIRLGEYVQSLAAALVQTYAIEPRRITLRTVISSDIELSSDRVVPIGLILNELIANALQHGLADQVGEITITLRVIDAQVTVIVGDSGGGFPADFDLNAPRSLGFQIINALVQQIDGRLRIDRTPETTVTFQFDAADLA